MPKMPYNKEKFDRISARGGPRDIQARQWLDQQKELLKSVVKSGEELVQPIQGDLSQYMLLSDVKIKILDAVEFTKKAEADKFIGTINALNDKILMYESVVKSKDDQIVDLRESVKTLNALLEGRFKEVSILQEKLDSVYDKISNGTIEPFVGSHMDKPALEGKIFIDPIEPGREEQMDSHIEIKEERSDKESDGRNIEGDLAKLRELLKK